MNKEEYILHREKIASYMNNNEALILFNKHDKEFKEAPDKNFFYATGIEENDDIVVILKKDDIVKSTLFIKPYNELEAKWVGKPLTKEEAFNISGISDILYIDTFDKLISSLINAKYNLSFDFNGESVSDEFICEASIYSKKLLNKYPYARISNGRGYLQSARTIKTSNEIEEIKKAISITNEGIMALLDNMKSGLYEYQLESYFDQKIKFYGFDGYSFDTIAASGSNACCLHYSTNNSVLKDGDLILFDLGATKGHYCADISRTFPINGKFSERQKEIYNIVLNGQKLVLKSAKPGLTTRDLNNILVDYYKVELKRIGLIKDDSEVSKYYFHSVSHHLGLDCHDLCDYTKLKPGCVISNEPGLYIIEEGIGIRIEDDILITEDGAVSLSDSIIKEVSDIENYMNNRKI